MSTKDCDCTVYCGDDPWLKNGRSKPCASMQAYLERQGKVQEIESKIARLCSVYRCNSFSELIQKLHFEKCGSGTE